MDEGNKNSSYNLDNENTRNLEESLMQNKDFRSLITYFYHLGRVIINVEPDKLPQLSDKIKANSTKIKKRSVDCNDVYIACLGDRLEGLANFVSELYKVYMSPQDDTEIKNFVRPLLEARLSTPVVYDSIAHGYEFNKDLIDFIYTNRKRIKEYLLKTFYTALKKSPPDLQNAANICYSFQLISWRLKRYNEDEGERMIDTHDFMLELLNAQNPNVEKNLQLLFDLADII